jgi:hypothetical protein
MISTDLYGGRAVLKVAQNAAWFAAFAFIVAFVVGAAMQGSPLDSDKKQAQSEQRSNDPDGQLNLIADNNSASKPFHWYSRYGKKIQEYWDSFISFLESHDKIVAGVSTIFIALFTIVLAVVTLFLWIATRDLVTGAENTAERQLRAYVFVQGGVIKLINNDTAVMAEVTLKNFGQTPGYEFETWTNIKISDPANPPFGGRKPPAQRSIIGPGADIFAPTQFIPITPQERNEINAGTKVIFVWGEAVYRDAFGKQRTFVFRDVNSGLELANSDNVTGRVLWRGWGLRPHALGYEEKTR